jgi:alpha-L-fucosidase 2
MIFGGIASERLTLNEDTVWSGAPVTGTEGIPNPDRLPEVRQLLFGEKFAEAEELLWDIVKPVAAFKDRFFGCAEILGQLDLHFDESAAVSDYRRDLDLDRAIARVRFVRDGITFTREVFASAPDQVIVVRLTADRAGKIAFTTELTRLERFTTRAEGNDTLTMSGQLRGSDAQNNGLRYFARLKAVTEGGHVTAPDRSLRVDGADAVTLLIAAGTDYLPRSPLFRGNPHETVTAKQLAAAAAKFRSIARRCSSSVCSVASCKIPFPKPRCNLSAPAPI